MFSFKVYRCGSCVVSSVFLLHWMNVFYPRVPTRESLDHEPVRSVVNGEGCGILCSIARGVVFCVV